MITDQRGNGHSFNDAAMYAIRHLGRSDLWLSFFDGTQLRGLGTFVPRGWLDVAVGDNASLLGFRYVSTYVPDGQVIVGLNVSSLVDIAMALARPIARYATRPLLEAATAMRSRSDGDCIPKAILASDLSEISAFNTAYNSAAANIEKAVADRDLAAENVRNFISDASHELKTPLTIIMGYVDAVSEGLVTDPHDAQRILKKALGECRRMRGTIERLIALARLYRDTANVVTFNVAALARQVTESMKPLVLELHVEMPPEGTKTLVIGDEGELREAIVNLVDNALKYAPGSPIDVRVSSSGDVVVLEVADAGPGIPVEDRERVFERFHRGSSHPSVEGSGLGLAIAQRAVQRAHGRITLTSELGRGTAVTLYLPAAAGPAVSNC
jgi:two-component system OmpR family sensor kinase